MSDSILLRQASFAPQAAASAAKPAMISQALAGLKAAASSRPLDSANRRKQSGVSGVAQASTARSEA